MSDLERTVGRLNEALGALETAIAEAGALAPAPPSNGSGKLTELRTERDKLAAEVARLERQVEEDAELRAEAADAVRAALNDLRAAAGATQESAGQGGPNG